MKFFDKWGVPPAGSRQGSGYPRVPSAKRKAFGRPLRAATIPNALTLIAIILLNIGCASNRSPDTAAIMEQDTANTLPDWVLLPPVEADAVYGIGGDKDPDKARLKALADIAWNLSVQVSSVAVMETTAAGTEKETAAAVIGKQMTRSTLRGAKFIEEITMPAGETWVLARMPLKCTMDVMSSAIVSYALELKVDTQPETLLAKVVRTLATTRAANPGIENPDMVPESAANLAAGRDPIKQQHPETAKLYARRALFQESLRALKNQRKVRRRWTFITLPIGGVALGAAGIALAGYSDAYRNYQNASSGADLDSLKNKAQESLNLTIALGAVGGSILGFSGIMALTTPTQKRINSMENEIANITQTLLRLENQP